MANREVNLTKRIRLADGTTRFCPVVLSTNGRVKPDHVIVDEKEERHTEGNYYLDWYEGSKRVRLSVGKNAQDAAAARLRKEAELNARNHGVAVLAEGAQNGKRSLQGAIDEFLEDTKAAKKPKTLAAYTKSLEYFTESCPKLYIEDVTRRDMLKFSAFLRDEKELAARTVRNKFENVMSFLKGQGIRGLVGKNDWPRFVQEEPEIYEKEELTKFFAACDTEERLWFEFFLMTGMREQEVMHTSWKDIKFAAAVVKMSHKPELNWTPKAYKEREIPVPAKLMQSLKKPQAKSNGCPLVFPTSGCKPKFDFLDCLKAVVKRASLNCGQCDGCKGKSQWCEHWFLHKFRATFATWALWGGTDLRTVQLWLGHNDIESTMRYLKPSRSEQTHAKVNEIFAGY